MMIMRAKNTGFCTSCAAVAITSMNVLFCPPNEVWRRMFSTITTDPSTTMPKSSAPSESRFAGICRRSSRIAANRSEKGIVTATISALRTFPRNRNRISVTSNTPSVKLRSTVCVVCFISSLRSRWGTNFTPTGSNPWCPPVPFNSSIFLCSASSVVSATAPLRNRTMPSTTSSLSIMVPSSL